MHVKNMRVQLKAGPADGLEDGQFEAYASVFGNVDSYGDVVQPGAFADTLKDWADSGDFLPVLFGHNMSDPEYNIGHVISAVEDEKGLRVRAQLDLETPKGVATYRLLKGRRISQMSFAYDVLDGSWGEKDGLEVYNLHKLKVYEVSVVPIGANQETEVLGVKAAAAVLAGAVKEGRVISAKNLDSLRSAHEAIGAVLASAEPVGTDEGKASVPPEVKSEGGDVKLEEPPAVASAQTLAWEALEAEISAECV
ncbi:capsid maturation protease [Arthrobacter phage Kepler]|uniref:Capsid maturation protease n=8 Tax=Coralvirus TaxID=2733171 RepID=A0A5J6TWZ3_9CAUD|nr:head maturation protease [Arthrobacter phage Coral]YP_009815835.1 head maturation protease [Arthrobacter phage Kepler]AYN57581.1 capsid maturation protease [Arthrobacter phage Cote]AYN57656.1 capsid maturation protease [Arthrobacter phage Daob]AYN58415.1 capsid maturation protease [Arthrobacter phage Lunar]AYN58557.1 capsid maturation protease [Arthrobacter phage Melons]AYN58763.1 capsid maturation protease [Arthrobacter phage Polka]QFG13062.1 capsid maturation protease [Arthrobacter phag